MSQKKRIVITGMGLVSPLGIGCQPSWDNLVKGTPGIGRITAFDPEPYASQIAAEVKGFDPDQWLDKKEQRKMDRFIQYGIAACDEAVNMAGLTDMAEDKKERTAVVIGSGIGGFQEIESMLDTLKTRGPRRISPFSIPAFLINLLPGQASIRYGFKGPNFSPVSACATGAHSIGLAARMIQHGEADFALAGGAEAAVTPITVAGFAAARALSTGYNSTPEKASRPFDTDRDGFVIGEGAGIVMLEEYEHAKARKADIIAEVSGFGQTGDAYHITMPGPGGEGAKRAMTLALKEAEANPDSVDYVNAHATSTPVGDETESQAIEEVFGPNVLVSSTKSMTGHMLGAAGSAETIFTALTIKHGVIPPTINLENVGEGCNLDYVPNTARETEVKVAVNNSFGFGGTNAALVLKKV